MYQTGTKAIAFPGIRRSIIRPVMVDGVCKFVELQHATHRKAGSYRQHSFFRNNNKSEGSRDDHSREVTMKLKQERNANLLGVRFSINQILLGCRL